MERLQRIAAHVCVDVVAPPRLGFQATVSPPASAPIVATLRAKITALAKDRLALKAELLKNGEAVLQQVTLDMSINGGRSIKSMVTETSDLDAQTGISYRGKSLYECNRDLPKAPGGNVALPEAAFWLLLTGEVPTDADVKAFSQELHRRSEIPQNVKATLDSLPVDTHPMTQLAICMLALQKDSKFAQQYDAGMVKSEYWEWCLEDALDLAAKIPVIAVLIYRRSFCGGKPGPAYNSKLDWGANFATMLGVNEDPEFLEVMRLYLTLHADHEGGNVSAHTTTLVGSALSDPFYSWAAGLCGLAGPLHGLANQECLEWLLETQKGLKGDKPTEARVTAYVEETLKAGKVIPGFGHAVLRQPDPRYMLQREFATKHCQGDPLFELVDSCFKAIPKILEKKGKVKNPYPNVDAHSGQLMYFYKLREPRYYTVLFAVSRALGCVAQLVWARALNLPLERPKSMPLDALKNLVAK